MYSKTKIRFYKLLFCLISITIGIYLILYSLSKNIIYFYYPSEIVKIEGTKLIKLGGLVKQGSIKYINQSSTEFILTDNTEDIEVHYRGILPLLFREGQGIIALGQLENNVFMAKQLLTKHDEQYRPPSPHN